MDYDALSSSDSSSYETTLDDMCAYTNWYVDILDQTLQHSPDDYWDHPFSNSKATLSSKLSALKDLINSYNFIGAYNKLLNDIKTKLTGLKNDENGSPRGNGVFKNPWVEDNDFQESLRLDCNELLLFIQILMSVN